MDNGSIPPEQVALAHQHRKGLYENLKQIYQRACEMATNNSRILVETVYKDETIGRNSAIRSASEKHQHDVEAFERGEISPNVPRQSLAKLNECIRNYEPNPQSRARQQAEQSNIFWDLVIGLGVALAAVAALISIVILK